MEHFISATMTGEMCGMCLRDGIEKQATHKVGEEIPHDAPKFRFGHNFTQYVCCYHFGQIISPYSAITWRGCPGEVGAKA